MDLNIKKDLASNWFKLLQNAICDDINLLENNKVKFKTTSWKRNRNKDEGGGEYRIFENGKIFEKVGVNFSKVYGKFPKQFQKNIPGADKDPRFWASGISIVMHMQTHIYQRFILTLDLFVQLKIGLVVGWMLLHQLKITMKKINFIKL